MSWTRRLGLEINPPVFFVSAALILGFVLYGAVFTEAARSAFESLQGGIVRLAGWFYVIAVALFLVFVIGLFISRYGQVRLGPDDSEPEFS